MEIKLPYLIKISLTSACNLKCSHCFQTAKKEELNYEVLENLINEFSEVGIAGVGITGGEPLIYKDIYRLLEQVKSKNIYCQLATNGVLLDEKTVKKLEHIGIDSVQISLEGHTEKINDAIRGVGVFEKVIDAINLLKKTKIHIVVAHTLNKSNTRYLNNMVKLCEDLNVDLRLELFLPLGNGAENSNDLSFDINSLRNLKASVNSITSDVIEIFKPAFDSKNGCGAGVYNCVINSDMTISPCDMLTDHYRSESFSNLKEFEKQWKFSKGLEEWRNIIVRDDYCSTCKESDNCGFGCRASAFAYKNNISSGDLLCLKRNQ